ncbi:MAG TPA: hypothetical protein VH092_18260, partial [Urbifossiella sp.]|nr:hypothetical protein [Urbifossiella sp.]
MGISEIFVRGDRAKTNTAELTNPSGLPDPQHPTLSETAAAEVVLAKYRFLRILHLNDTNVTDAGVATLQKSAPVTRQREPAPGPA